MGQLKPLAEDTSLEVEELLLQRYRELEVHEKIALILDLSRLSEDAALVGIRERYPEEPDRRHRLRLAALKYGRELVLEAFGWDPLVEGW
jgi:hypothetical protein